jgi:3-oxoadipate enol-lactonase
MDIVLPPARPVVLPGRGTTTVRELAGPPGAPAVVLLHGWTATSSLNWFRCFAPLAERYRVIALDHRGHGQGIRSRRPFRLEDCADDVAALADALDLPSILVTGYSMGGAVAQLVWRRHRDLVAGLVLCATSGTFAESNQERLNFAGLGGIAAMSRVVPTPVLERLAAQYVDKRSALGWQEWALEELRRHHWTAVLEAGASLGLFSSRRWIAEVDVPTSVVITTADRTVPRRLCRRRRPLRARAARRAPPRRRRLGGRRRRGRLTALRRRGPPGTTVERPDALWLSRGLAPAPGRVRPRRARTGHRGRDPAVRSAR